MYQNKRQTSYWLLSIVMVLFVGICAERFQTDYRLSFPQDVRTEAALKGEPPGGSEEQYFGRNLAKGCFFRNIPTGEPQDFFKNYRFFTIFLLPSGTSPAGFYLLPGLFSGFSGNMWSQAGIRSSSTYTTRTVKRAFLFS